MNTAYIHALADALVAQGRRYGLSNNARAHLIEILSSVPSPCCKESCDKPSPSTSPANGSGRTLEAETELRLREAEDKAIAKTKQEAVRVSAPGVPVAEPQGATSIPAALPSDEKIAAAVQATADAVLDQAIAAAPTPLELAPDNVVVDDEKV